MLNNFYYLISLDQSEIKIKQIKMRRCVSLEREIEDGDCVTGTSVKFSSVPPAQYQLKFKFSESFADLASYILVKKHAFFHLLADRYFFTISQRPFNHPDPVNKYKQI